MLHYPTISNILAKTTRKNCFRKLVSPVERVSFKRDIPLAHLFNQEGELCN